MNIKEAILEWSGLDIEIKNNEVWYNYQQIHGSLVDKILSMMKEGKKSFERFAKFLDLVIDNPSLKTRERLMEFVSAEDIQIDEDGFVLAFKNVDEEGYSKHAGYYNILGEYVPDERYYHASDLICSMPRQEVDDEESNTCSKGLHVCSIHYLASAWGTEGKNFLVRVNPIDFVAIPPDYKNSKARVCEYRCVKELTKEELRTIIEKDGEKKV